jgi:hypothetical protein
MVDIDLTVPSRVNNYGFILRANEIRKMGKTFGFDAFEYYANSPSAVHALVK